MTSDQTVQTVRAKRGAFFWLSYTTIGSCCAGHAKIPTDPSWIHVVDLAFRQWGFTPRLLSTGEDIALKLGGGRTGDITDRVEEVNEQGEVEEEWDEEKNTNRKCPARKKYI